MPDPATILLAQSAAFMIALVTVGAAGRVSVRHEGRDWRSVGWIVSLVAASIAGMYLLGLPPEWPPVQDRDRLFLVVLPAGAIAELVCALFPRRPGVGWLLRIVVAMLAARIVLHGSIYVADVAGPGSRQWNAWQTTGMTMAVGCAVLLVGTTARRGVARWGGGWVVLALAAVAAAAGLTIMLSGYATGGQGALPLAAALIGGWVGARVSGRPADASLGHAVHLAVLLLWGLLVSARFFAELTTLHLVLLGAAPAAIGAIGWQPRRTGRWVPVAVGLAVTLLLCGAVVYQAQQRFAARSGNEADVDGSAPTPSIGDYMDFGK